MKEELKVSQISPEYLRSFEDVKANKNFLKFSCPFLLISAELDFFVEYVDVEDFYIKMKSKNKDITWQHFNSHSHRLVKVKNMNEFYNVLSKLLGSRNRFNKIKTNINILGENILDKTLKKINSLKKRKEKTTRKLEKQKKEKAKVLNKIASAIADQKKTKQKLIDDEKKLTRIIETLIQRSKIEAKKKTQQQKNTSKHKLQQHPGPFKRGGRKTYKNPT